MKKLCIVDLDLTNNRGVEHVTVNLANSLRDRFEVTVLAIREKGSVSVFRLDPEVRYCCLDVQAERIRSMIPEVKKAMPRFLAEHPQDVYILQGAWAAFFISSLKVMKKETMIFFDHGALMTQWDDKKTVFMRWLSAKRCRLTVTLTEQNKTDYVRKFRMKAEKFRCIYNWIDPDVPVSGQYDLSSRRLISAGRIDPEKGFDLLVKAFAPVVKKHPDWHLDIFGDGETKQTVEALIRENGVEENIHLPGTVNDLDRRYKDYAMYVLPSYREGMPLVLLEAKANRLPIISFDIRTGPKEIVTDGVNGLLIEPYDTEKMTAAIERLIGDEALRQSMSDHALDDIGRFSKQEILSQWIDLLETI